MEQRLESLRQQLGETIPNVAIRGSEAASFVFAEYNGRAIEASIDNERWWIEFWERNEDEDAAPLMTRTITDDDDALQIIRGWLLKASSHD